MKKIVTILCSLAFMLSGSMLAITATDSTPDVGYKTISAATIPYIQTPTQPCIISSNGIESLSDDLVRDLAVKRGVLDTVYITKTDTKKEQVTKVKWCRAPAPAPIIVRDTIRETHYYLATQVGTKEGPPDQCIPIYEVHEVDRICPENINSSVSSPIELNSD